MTKADSKKTILFVGNTAWSMFNFRLDVMRALSAKGFDVKVIAPDDDYGVLFEKDGIQFVPIKIDNKGTSLLKDFKLFKNLKRLYREIRPDLIFHYTIKPNIYGSIAAGRSNIRSVAFVTGAGSVFIKETILTKLVKALFRYSFRYSSKVWFLNQDDYNLFVSNRLVDHTRCEVLPGEGIDTLSFNPQLVSNSNTGDMMTFLFMGRLLWDKGVGEYVQAAREIKKKYKNIRFRIVGFLDALNPSAISKRQLDEWIAEGVVEYLGSTNDVKPVLAEADCLVLPSYREGIPRSILEASSMAMPVIASDTPGCRDLVQDGVNGYLCRPRNYKSLANKMKKLIEISEDQRLFMGEKGRERVIESFDIKIIIDKYKMTVEELI